MVWVITAALALFVVRIVYLEVHCGRRSREFLDRTNAQIDTFKREATVRYREKFGRDPTDTFKAVDMPKIAATKKP
jgi:hypothetical protein